jgi:hypothetical protein
MLLAQDKVRAAELLSQAKEGIATRWNQIKHLADENKEAN